MKIGRKALEGSQRELMRMLELELHRMFGRKVGCTLFLFDFGDGGNIAYISNAEREGMIGTVREWLARQEAGLTTDPPGPKVEG